MNGSQLLALSAQPDTHRGAVETVLRVSGLRKEFRFYRHPWDRFVEWMSGGRLQRSQVFTALEDVNFEVAKGGALGVIGANGAGKSTLLKIICGTLYPTAGQVELSGRVASLLELGTGFHPDFTGRQNVIFNARFLGLGDEEIHGRMDAIIAFSELGEFIDRPLRTYSSGMYVRLAFAVLANIDPHILVIDEALAVGDAYFQQKCIRRIRQFREDGVTLLFVSHDPTAVKTLCQEAILLHHGRLVDRGRPDDVLEYYNTLIAREAGSRELLSLEREKTADEEVALRRSGNFAMVIEDVTLCDARGQEGRSFIAGEEVCITVRAWCLDQVVDPTVGILIRDRLGNDVYGTNTYHQQIVTGPYDCGERLEVTFRFALNLGPGDYTLTVAVHTLDVHIYDSFDWIDRLLVFKILPPFSGRFIGTAFLQPQVTCQQTAALLGREEADRVLAAAFGRQFPSVITAGEAGKPWLFSGWSLPERQGAETFCETSAVFRFLIDLRGEQLHFEVGLDCQQAESPSLLLVWLFDFPLGELLLQSTEQWTIASLPIPPSCQVAHGLVRAQIKEGVNGGHAAQGVRVRRIWVA